MSYFISIMEISSLSREEIEGIQTLSLKELLNARNIFLVFEDEKDERHEEIMPLLTRVKHSEGNIIYVARVEYHLLCSDRIIYRCMRELSSVENPRYVDITHYAGKRIGGWESRYDDTIMGYRQRELNYEIPSPRKGGRLFYHAC